VIWEGGGPHCAGLFLRRLTSRKVPRIILILCLFFARGLCCAQDLAPRAYIITPLHSNAITLIYSFYDGILIFDGTVPITGASARVNLSVFSAYHSFNFSGRTASFLVSLPYGVGNFRGNVVGAETLAYRSGLLPATFRLSVNLIGGPSMTVEEFSKCFKLVPATGQYNPTKLINYGTNRWAVLRQNSESKLNFTFNNVTGLLAKC
jgi:hypothetical protein